MYAAVSAACNTFNQHLRSLVDERRTAYQIIQLDGRHALVDTRDDLHGDGGGVDMLRVEAITEPRHTGGDFVELYALLASICSARQYWRVGWDGMVKALSRAVAR
jgi:hypothetical protein